MSDAGWAGAGTAGTDVASVAEAGCSPGISIGIDPSAGSSHEVEAGEMSRGLLERQEASAVGGSLATGGALGDDLAGGAVAVVGLLDMATYSGGVIV